MKTAIAGLGIAMLALAASPAAAAQLRPQSQAGTPGNAEGQAVDPAPLVPADFVVPTSAQGEGFRLVPLGPAVVDVDFDAYMSSIEHLQTTFSRSKSWPHAGISAADAMHDMESEQARFESRKSFAYAVLTPDGKRERGSVYISPSPVEGYDAMVRMWVTKADYDAGFDARLFDWVSQWVHSDWPFTRVAYPGRTIDWETWDALGVNSPPA